MGNVTLNGKTVDFDAAVNLMDDELRDMLSSSQDWASDQDFLDAYVDAHADKFGEDFKVA